MLRELVSYHRPRTLRDALQLLKQPHTIALAGGTELLGRSDTSTDSVVDLQDAGLDYVRAQDNVIHIGAMTRLQSFIDHPVLSGFAGDLLTRAAAYLTNTERQAATVGGLLAAGRADSELLASLLVLDATVEIQTAETQQLISAEVLVANRERYLTSDALITELMAPAQPGAARYALERVSRTPADRAIVCVAARLVQRDGRLHAVRVAVGGAGDHVMRLMTAEAVLEGAPSTAQAFADGGRAALGVVAPPSDHRATGEYRGAMVGVLLERVLGSIIASLESDKHA